MDVSDNVPARLKVSIITRLVGVLVYMIPAIGAALGSLLLMNLFRELRNSEVAGVSTLMKGMNEASLPVIISLYLAAFFGVALIIVLVIRMIVQTKTASPPFWFFVVGGLLSLVPAVFFWKSQLLILEAISPGSSIGSAGIGGVAAEISELLLIGLVMAPVVFIVLVVLSVVPLKSRPGTKWGSLIAAVVIELMLISTAIAVPFLIDGPKRKNEIVTLPANFKNADRDDGIDRETSMVLTMGADNKLYQRQTSDKQRTDIAITKEELPARIERSMQDKTPDRRTIYFKCDINAAYESVLQILDIIRKADVDRVGLVVIGVRDQDDPYQTASLIFDVRLPEPMDNARPLKPNPLTLVAMQDADGKLKLNNEDAGTVSDPDQLRNKLRDIFKDRENNGVFREGSNEIEKTIFLKMAPSGKYGNFMKLVEAVKGAGANPIDIYFDDVMPVQMQEIDPNELRPVRLIK